MQFSKTLVLAILGAASTVTAVPNWSVRPAEDIVAGAFTIGDLEVTNKEHFPGQVFTGTAESIFAEMSALNPDIMAARAANATTEASLQARGTAIRCGWNNNPVGQWYHCTEGVGYLQNLGTAWCGVKGGGGQCSRVSCSHTCGIFMCNNSREEIREHCNVIAHEVNQIAAECITPALGRFCGTSNFPSH